MIELKQLLKKPYIYSLIIIFIIYLILLLLISGFYQSIILIFIYAKTINWFELGLSIVFSLIIGILVSVNSLLIYLNYRKMKKCKEAGAIAGIGTLSGLAVGVCPLCVTGLFPLLFSFFGVTFSFVALPFKGLEIQILVIFLLSVSLRMLSRSN